MKILQKLTIIALLSTAYGTAWGMETVSSPRLRQAGAAESKDVAAATALVETKTAAADAEEFPRFGKQKFLALPAEIQRSILEEFYVPRKVRRALNQYRMADAQQGLHHIAWAPNNTLFFANKDGISCINFSQNAQPTSIMPIMPKADNVPLLAINGDGTQLAVAYEKEGIIELWDIGGETPTKKTTATLKEIPLIAAFYAERRCKYALESISFSPHNNSQLIMCTQTYSGFSGFVTEFAYFQISLPEKQVTLLDTSPHPHATTNADGTITAHINKKTKTITLRMGKGQPKTLRQNLHLQWVSMCASGKYLVSATGSYPDSADAVGILTIWDTASQQPLLTTYSTHNATKEYSFATPYTINGIAQKDGSYNDAYVYVNSDLTRTKAINHRIAFSPDETYLANCATVYRINDQITFPAALIPLLDYLYTIQEKNGFTELRLEATTWNLLQQLDPFSLRAFMQNLQLLPPVEETAVATSAGSSAGAAAEAKKN